MSTNIEDTASKIEVGEDFMFFLFLPLYVSIKGCYVKRKIWKHKFYRMGKTKKIKHMDESLKKNQIIWDYEENTN